MKRIALMFVLLLSGYGVFASSNVKKHHKKHHKTHAMAKANTPASKPATGATTKKY